MKLKQKILIGTLAIAAACGIAGTTLVGHSELINRADTGTYVCRETVFGTTFNSNAYGNGDTTSAIAGNGYTITINANANHSATYSEYPLKLGGSKANKYVGSVTITFTGTCDKVMIYATGWSGGSTDKDPKLAVNGDSKDVASNTGSKAITADSYELYTFEFDKTNTVTITNGDATATNRVLISKLVFRVY